MTQSNGWRQLVWGRRLFVAGVVLEGIAIATLKPPLEGFLAVALLPTFAVPHFMVILFSCPVCGNRFSPGLLRAYLRRSCAACESAIGTQKTR